MIRLFYELMVTLQAMSPWDGAQNSIHLASSPTITSFNGAYFSNLKPTEPKLGPYPAIVQKLLWEASAEKTHLSVDL